MWYVLRVRSGKELDVKEVLSKRFEVLFPSSRKLEVFVDGRRRYRISLGGDKEVKVGGVRIRVKDGSFRVEGSDPRVRVEVKEGESPLRGYLFVKGSYEELLKRAEKLKDVFGFLVLGGKVRSLSDEEMMRVVERVEKEGKLRGILPERGSRVKVVSGEWTGADGIIEELYEDMTAKIRLRLWGRTFTEVLPLENIILIR